MAGAGIDVMALASVRATREATVKRDGHELPVIVGTPMEGETIAGERFDGQRKTAIFPGDLPEDPESLFDRIAAGETGVQLPDVNVVRFRPPHLEETGGGIKLSVPHIRLDRAMQFLFGDRLA
jgi:predicted YcjX-like family ATPase